MNNKKLLIFAISVFFLALVSFLYTNAYAIYPFCYSCSSGNEIILHEECSKTDSGATTCTEYSDGRCVSSGSCS